MAAKQSQVEIKTGLKKIMKPVISTDVMGNRNVEVKAVGARAEPAFLFSQHRPPNAVLAAQEQEEKIAAMQQEKEERLSQFQKDVRKRVQKITRTQRKQQLEKEYEKMHAFASEARQKLSGRRVVDDDGEIDNLPLSQWSKVNRQTQPTETAWDEVSHDYYQEEENDLEKFRRDEREGEDIEEDKDDRVKDHESLGFDRLHTVKFDLQENQDEEILEKKTSKRTTRKSCRPKSASVFDLRSGATEAAERTRQGQQLLSYRRLCSDVERQVARDNAQRKRQRKMIERLKRKKEDWRMQEEEQARRIVEPRDPVTGDTCFETSLRDQLERTHLQEVLQEREDKRNKQLEMTRYLDALRKNLQEKLIKKGLELPSLCCCGETLWDTNPDTCANNCFFYRNHRAYARALQSLLVSADIV
ncbi:hypothetical protein C0Q70_12814 [Pomacea canaliculata]|uniref:Coiled-coil domain-containing protein 15 n=1 Tax=Pomacea canaliculata TaxID=400727 RepID=A0A2T7P2J2_POMCA|nr:hypothetical protein C0Q70_12814 [Pomacea canaliculata]